MADFITEESVVTPVKSPLDIKTMYNQSVVFEFNGGIDPIACDLKYLYAENINPMINDCKVLNLDKEGSLDLFGYSNNGLNTVFASKRYRFINVIRYLAFKYGLKHEYYKNKYGMWIDILAIRPQYGVKYDSNVIFRNWYVGDINDEYLESSIYVKLCDLPQFNGNNMTGIMKNFFVENINLIPACKYIINIPNTSEGKVAYIGKADGTFQLEKVKKYNFRQLNETNDVLSDDIIWFKYELVDHNTGALASGNFSNNNHHKFDDLVLTFIDRNGNPYTDLDNLFITLNGMIVDYQIQVAGSNRIYINNVIKYAEYQIKGLKEGYSLDNKSIVSEDNHGNRIINYEVDNDELGYVWTFDINITKWEGVSVSHFEEPISSKSLLKSEPTEDKRSFWLTTGLVFSSAIDKNKCILICGNEIVSKDSWNVDKDDKHVVNLVGISAEFDIIYAEMYKQIKLFTQMMIGHNLNQAPKITDFLKDHYTSQEEVEQAMDLYEAAVEEYKQNGGEYNYHYYRSAIEIVKRQFIDRQYAIIKFDSLETLRYNIEVTENHLDLQFNVPKRDRMRNLNWAMDDIVIINGIRQFFVNEYSDVFKPVAKWYLTDIKNTLDDVNGYKLEVCKHYKSLDKYVKLNYSMLSRGPIEGREYFEYNERLDQYIPVGEIEDFSKSYVRLTPEEIANGFDKIFIKLDDNEIANGPKYGIDYYIKIAVPNQLTKYEKVSLTRFETGTEYYRIKSLMERDVIYYTKVVEPGQPVDLQNPFDDEPIFDHSTVISPGSPIRFERVPSSFTTFEEGETYYKLVFNKDYYMLKK